MPQPGYATALLPSQPSLYIYTSPIRPLSLHLPPFPHFPSHTSNCSYLAIIEVRGGTEVRIGSRQHVENQVVPPSIPAGTYVHRREGELHDQYTEKRTLHDNIGRNGKTKLQK